MPPNKTTKVTPAVPHWARYLLATPILKLPPPFQNQMSAYFPPLPLHNKFNKLFNISIGPNFIPKPTLIEQLTGNYSCEVPIIETHKKQRLISVPEEANDPSIYISTNYDKQRFPMSPISTEESGGVKAGFRLGGGWRFEVRAGYFSSPDPNNPNNM